MIIKFQDIIPPLTDEEFHQLEQNILKDGIRDPLVMWGGMLIDGHNRYKIAQKHGLEFKTVQMDFINESEAKIWIITNQLGRRNIPSTGVRAMLGLELEPLYAERAKDRQRGGQGGVLLLPPEGQSKIHTRDQLAKIAKVGKASIDYAKYIKEHAPQDIMQQVTSGEMPLRTAYKETAKLFPPQPRAPRVEDAEKVAAVRPASTATEKTCTTCGRTLPVERFYFSQGRYSSGCIQCERMKKSGGISSTIREDIKAIHEATDYMTDTERVIEYAIEDVNETIAAGFTRLIRMIDTETMNHADLMKNPENKEALLKALAHGVGQIQEKMKEVAGK